MLPAAHLASVEKERLIAADRQRAMEAQRRRLGRDIAKIQREQTAETEALDGGRPISVDLDLHEVSPPAEVRLAELRQLNLNGDEFQWYNVDAFRDIT
jgi:hypothetical protein